MAKKEINFAESAKQIVELVGGKENVSAVTHCMTRVRFTLKDNSIASANKDKVAAVDGVMQIVESGGQFQVVIGTAVEKMFNEVVALTGEGNAQAAEEETGEKKGIGAAIMKLVSGIMMPVVPGMAGCGLVACLVSLLNMAGLVSPDSGTYTVLYSISQTCLYFFPVLVGCSAAKYFKMDQYLGGVIGAALMYPTFIELAAAGEATKLFGFIPLTYTNYANTVFPAIVSVWFASVLYKFFKKHIPDVLSFAMVPFLTVLCSVPVAILAIGPVTNMISGFISTASMAIYNFSPILCGILLGGTWLIFIVPLGLHWGFTAIFMNNYVTLGYEPVMGLLCGMMALCGTLVAVGLKAKKEETKSLAFSTAVTCFFGISEPGLYGIILQHKETIITSIIGGAIAGIFPAIFHTALYVLGGMTGAFSIFAYINPDGSWGSTIGWILCNLVGFVACFALTMMAKFDPDKTTA